MQLHHRSNDIRAPITCIFPALHNITTIPTIHGSIRGSKWDSKHSRLFEENKFFFFCPPFICTTSSKGKRERKKNAAHTRSLLTAIVTLEETCVIRLVNTEAWQAFPGMCQHEVWRNSIINPLQIDMKWCSFHYGVDAIRRSTSSIDGTSVSNHLPTLYERKSRRQRQSCVCMLIHKSAEYCAQFIAFHLIFTWSRLRKPFTFIVSANGLIYQVPFAPSKWNFPHKAP